MIANLDTRFQTAIAGDLPGFLVNPTEPDRAELERRRGDARRRCAAAARRRTTAAPARPAAGQRLPVVRRRRRTSPAPRSGSTRRRPAADASSDAARQGRPVDFWTYTCINCIRTLPYLEAWDAEVPQGRASRSSASTRRSSRSRRTRATSQDAIGRHGLTYPVVQDNDLRDLERLRQPVLAGRLPDRRQGQRPLRPLRRGRLRARPSAAIRTLLARGRARAISGGQAQRAAPRRPGRHATPETYLGAARAQRFVNGPIQPGDQQTSARLPAALAADQLAYGGHWEIARRGRDRRARARARPGLQRARGSSWCSARPDGPRTCRCSSTASRSRTRSPAPTSTDGVATISAQRLYRLVDLPQPGSHVLTLQPGDRDRGLRVHVRLAPTDI